MELFGKKIFTMKQELKQGFGKNIILRELIKSEQVNFDN